MSERWSCQMLKRLPMLLPMLLSGLLGVLAGVTFGTPTVYADAIPEPASSESAISELAISELAISELDDAVSRAQYAFYTGDARGLEEILGLIERLDVPTTLASMKAYYAAYGSWKLAQLYTDETSPAAGQDGMRAQADKAAKACVRHSESTLKLDSHMAEAHAIDAICSALAPGLRITSCARSKALRTALELGPDNPRVRFIELLCSMEKTDAAAVQIERLRTLVAMFERAPASVAGKPDWGHAEALMLLGQSYLQRGDLVVARDAIERALVIAPDYRKAQELLQAASRPR